MDRAQTISFVKDTLGCNCPDDVFLSIARESRGNPDVVFHVLESHWPEFYPLVTDVTSLGGRLLILNCGSCDIEGIRSLISMGRSVRDFLQFNRVRIVLNRSRLSDNQIMDLLRPSDSRTHIHFTE